MAVFNTVALSQLEQPSRLDPEYYQPEYVELSSKLRSLPHRQLGSLSKRIVSFGAYSLTNFIEWKSSGIPFVEAENIKDGFVDYGGVRFIDDSVDSILAKSRVQEGMVLLAMSGSVGNAAVAYRIPDRLNSNQDIAKITPIDGFSPYLLSLFLNSKFGRTQVLRLPVGSVQQHIFLWQIKRLLVPDVFDTRLVRDVQSLCVDALDKIKKSVTLLSQAEVLLLRELGLEDYTLMHLVSYTGTLSGTCEVRRIDAEYFQPAYDDILKRIRGYVNGSIPLLRLVENVDAGFEPKRQPKDLFTYVELANIDTSIGLIAESTKLRGEEAPSRARRILHKNDVLVSSVEGSLGKAAMVDDRFEGALASTGFFQFRPEGILPEVLLVLSRNIVLQSQLRRQCAGTILTAVPSEGLRRISVPRLQENLQKQIAAIVKESHATRRQADDLLNTAKAKVEAAIEREIEKLP